MIFGCQSRETRDWFSVLKTCDSLAAAGDTAAALDVVQALLLDSRVARADTSLIVVVDTLAARMKQAGNFNLAVALYYRALQLPIETSGPAKLRRAQSQTRLGSILVDLGRFPEASAVLDSARAAFETLPATTHPAYAGMLDATATLHYSSGNYPEALKWHKQALSVHSRIASDDILIGSTWANLGNTWTALAQPDSAEAAYLHAISILERHRPESDYRYLSTLINLANHYADLEQYDDALENYYRALEIVNTRFSPTHPRAAAILIGIASVEFYRDNWDSAEARFRQALAIYEHRGIKEPAVADCEFNLGNLFYYRQQYDSAETHARRSLQILEETIGAGQSGSAHGLLAQIYAAQGESHNARREDSTGFAISRNKFLTHYSSLSEDDALRFAAGFRHQTSYYLTTQLASRDMLPDTSEQLAATLLLAKGLVQDGAFARQRMLRDDADLTLRAKLDSLHALRIRTAHLAAYMSQLRPSQSLQAELRDLKAHSARLENEIAAQNPVHRDYVDVPADSVYAALHRLAPGSFVLDYFVFDSMSVDDRADPHYVVAVFNDTGFVACVSLGPAKTIDRRVRMYRDYLESPRVAAAEQIHAASRSLYEAVWSPVMPFLNDARLVFVCPDGELNRVSFAGLSPDDKSFLIERFPIHYLSSPRDLTRRSQKQGNGKGMIVLGDPDYGGMLPPLSHAGNEVRAVAATWQTAFAEPIQLLIGAQAGERNFRGAFSRARVLYVAAHSTEALKSNVTPDSLADAIPNGILLAEFRGLNDSTLTDHDGLLSAEEILALDFTGTDLVVLSTCESGGGRLIQGEGVHGLRRAFQMAGVSTVISSLWPVDDRSTAELMKHGLFSPTAPYPETLRDACLARIQELRAAGESPNPFLWAAFISDGDWR